MISIGGEHQQGPIHNLFQDIPNKKIEYLIINKQIELNSRDLGSTSSLKINSETPINVNFAVILQMNVKATQFWANAPPAGIYDSLISSGLISKNTDVVSRTPVTPMKLTNINSRRSTSINVKRSPPVVPKTTAKPLEQFATYRPRTASLGKNMGKAILNQIDFNALSPSSNTSDKEINRPKTTMTSLRNIIPPKSASQTFIDDVAASKRNHAGRREAHQLLESLNALVDEAKEEDLNNFTAPEQCNILSKRHASYVLIWNELILQLKTHNEDYALISTLIKNFFQELLQDMPKVFKKYNEEHEQMQQQIDLLNEENLKLTKQLENMAEEQENLQNELKAVGDKICAYAANETKQKNENNDMLFRLDEQKGQVDELMFRIGKLEENKKSMQAQLEAKESIIENCNTQIKTQEETIAKYDAEGAGFRPLYTRASEELSNLKTQFEELTKEVEVLRLTKERTDVMTEPIPELQVDLVTGATGKKLNKNSKRRNGSIKMKDPSYENFNFNKPSFNLKNQMEKNKSQAKYTGLTLLQSEDQSESSPNSASSHKSIMSVASNSSIQPLSSNRDDDIHSLISKNSSHSGSQLALDPIASKSKESLFLSKESLGVEEIQNITEVSLLPDDYQISKAIFDGDNSSFISYVDRLFSLPCIDVAPVSDSKILMGDLEKAEIEIKSFSWTLRQVVLILQNSFQFDSFSNAQQSFLDVIAKILTDSGKNSKIVQRIQSNFMNSLNYHRVRSNAIKFFLLFLSNEYSLVDFRFFNMLFNLCFKAIYPAVDDILTDPDLTDDHQFFLINKAFFDQIARIMLRLPGFPEENLNKILKETTQTAFPDLVNFWAFSREMIELFKEVHQTYHFKVKNVFKIIGSSDNESITRFRFREFLRIVCPDFSEAVIKKLWERVTTLGKEVNPTDISYEIFMRFCGEYTELSTAIVELPTYTNFVQTYTLLSQPVLTLFSFIRKRYSELLPSLMDRLNSDLCELMSSCLIKIRNSFLKCDVATAFMWYRHILQIIDLKLTESNPYTIFTSMTTSTDVNRMISHLKMRECLASILIDFDNGESPQDIIQEAKTNSP